MTKNPQALLEPCPNTLSLLLASSLASKALTGRRKQRRTTAALLLQPLLHLLDRALVAQLRLQRVARLLRRLAGPLPLRLLLRAPRALAPEHAAGRRHATAGRAVGAAVVRHPRVLQQLLRGGAGGGVALQQRGEEGDRLWR